LGIINRPSPFATGSNFIGSATYSLVPIFST
jgi:hypothetical protein